MPHVLLLEPDVMLAACYYGALEHAGFTVRVCTTAQAAILAADESRPDLVVLELQLVGHGGIEFLYEFRSYSDWQAVPVIVLSYIPSDEFSGSWQVLQKELGIQAYLHKPKTSLKRLVRSASALTAAG